MRWVKKPMAAQMKRAQTNMTYVVDGNKCANAVPQGQYFQLINSTIAGRSDGVYTASKAIPANEVIDNTYFNQTSPISEGAINKINGELATLNSNITTLAYTGTVDSLQTSLVSLASSMSVGDFHNIKYTATETLSPFRSTHLYGGMFKRTGSNYWSVILEDPESLPIYGTYRNGTWAWDELALNSNLTWTKILDSAIFSETGNVTIPSITNYKELLVIVDTRRASDNQPFGYSNSLHLPAFLYGSNSITFAIPLAVGNFLKFLFTASTLYITELGTLPASANAYIVSIYAR